MRHRDAELAKGWVQIVPTLSVETAGGKQKMGCPTSKSLLRIIQSIPSPKAEPFKLWLVQVGSDRLDEIENPEVATQRTRELYRLKGYPDGLCFWKGVTFYQPTVSIQTEKLNDKIEIKVTDNGNGILKNIVDTIFQPFFTTKPTVQGTGLGLSLSYNIVKAHGGDIK